MELRIEARNQKATLVAANEMISEWLMKKEWIRQEIRLRITNKRIINETKEANLTEMAESTNQTSN